jgi:membrane peptidoglycan carboxypeptidase
LANDGEYHEPYYIDRVEDRNGQVLFKQNTKGERAVSVHNARTVTQTLTQVVQRGTGTAAQVPRWQVAGKTGSTDENQDAWFVGVTPKLATAVWMGSPAGKVSMYNVGVFPRVYGGTYPAMIFSAYMKQFLAGQAVIDFAPPDRVPNQRAPKFLELPTCLLSEVLTPKPCGEVTDTGRRTTTGPTQQVQRNNDDGNANEPVVTVPRPSATVPQPVVPQVPVITIPVFPDVTTPRVTSPPVIIDDSPPTTRRNRG